LSEKVEKPFTLVVLFPATGEAGQVVLGMMPMDTMQDHQVGVDRLFKETAKTSWSVVGGQVVPLIGTHTLLDMETTLKEVIVFNFQLMLREERNQREVLGVLGITPLDLQEVKLTVAVEVVIHTAEVYYIHIYVIIF
jgi:hypothetical protein